MSRYVSYRDFDWLLLVFVLLICGMGVMEIHSATMHTKFAGAHIKHGDYPEHSGVTHVNLLRTLEAMYKLNRSGNQQKWAQQAGIRDDYIITDVFEAAP